VTELAVWEPSQEARENHAPPGEDLSAIGSSRNFRNHRGLERKVEEGACGGSTHQLNPRACWRVLPTRHLPGDGGEGEDH
jgi:hypothetical protein